MQLQFVGTAIHDTGDWPTMVALQCRWQAGCIRDACVHAADFTSQMLILVLRVNVRQSWPRKGDKNSSTGISLAGCRGKQHPVGQVTRGGHLTSFQKPNDCKGPIYL